MKKFECDDARGTRAEQHVRNPRKAQTRVNADARNARVLLILLVKKVVVVVVVVSGSSGSSSGSSSSNIADVVEMILIVILMNYRRKFRSQTSDNMDR